MRSVSGLRGEAHKISRPRSLDAVELLRDEVEGRVLRGSSCPAVVGSLWLAPQLVALSAPIRRRGCLAKQAAFLIAWSGTSRDPADRAVRLPKRGYGHAVRGPAPAPPAPESRLAYSTVGRVGSRKSMEFGLSACGAPG